MLRARPWRCLRFKPCILVACLLNSDYCWLRRASPRPTDLGVAGASSGGPTFITLPTTILRGRATGSPGFEKAAAYMVEQFRAAGLQSPGVDGYRQPMDFHVVQIAKLTARSICCAGAKRSRFKLGDDAVFAINSHEAESVQPGAVFVGYGLTVPELHYDDFAGQDVKGKGSHVYRRRPVRHRQPRIRSGDPVDQKSAKGRSQKPESSALSPYRIPGAPEVPWSRDCRGPVPATHGIERSPATMSRIRSRLASHSTPHMRKPSSRAAATAFKRSWADLNADKPLPHFPFAVTIRAHASPGSLRARTLKKHQLRPLPKDGR